MGWLGSDVCWLAHLLKLYHQQFLNVEEEVPGAEYSINDKLATRHQNLRYYSAHYIGVYHNTNNYPCRPVTSCMQRAHLELTNLALTNRLSYLQLLYQLRHFTVEKIQNYLNTITSVWQKECNKSRSDHTLFGNENEHPGDMSLYFANWCCGE